MEQKQLDELDESYFGDEFIEEDSVVITPARVEPKTESKDTSTAKAAKKVSKKETKKVAKKETKSATKKASKVKEEKKVATKVTEVKKEPLEKEVAKKDEKTVEVSSPVNPWNGENKQKAVKAEVKSEAKPESEKETTIKAQTTAEAEKSTNENAGFFRETSTWKAISGIILILLVFSVFTQGFQFSEDVVTTSAVADLSLVQAENKVLEFVNTNLLQAPFQATIISSEDVGSLYKVTLSIAGQQVDSYLTKDGQTFFPQGIDTSISLIPTEDPNVVELEQSEDTIQEGVVEETPEEVVEMPVEEAPIEENVKTTLTETQEPQEVVTEPVQTTPVTETKSFTLVSKKWSFTPDVVRVKQGDLVRLTISPNSDNPTFALNQFTFGVPELNVEQQVNGQTVVEFTADKTGNFPFTCTSCESWRGMSGTLVVE